MTCSRSWQIEAIRDGRLTGADLVTALRHRERCADCARVHLELTELGRTLAQLPLLERDSMTTHRERQRLMAAMNDAVLAPARGKASWRRSGVLIAALAIAVGLFGTMRWTSSSVATSNVPRSIVEVLAQPGSTWSEHIDASTDRIDLTDGSASFLVHPHQGRTVVVHLPDGEVRDMGTVFEVDVRQQQTRSVTVHEGRVSVYLQSRPAFTLSAGQAWRQPESGTSATSAPSATSAYVTSGSTPPGTIADHRPSAKKPRAAVSKLVATAPSKPEHDAPPESIQRSASRTEDRAYLSIVTLLNQKKYAAAQSAAKQYLLEFPNGFRRVEVLNVVMHAANDDPTNGD